MAMELFVFSDRQLDSIAEWNTALAELEFDVVIEESGRISDLNGPNFAAVMYGSNTITGTRRSFWRRMKM
jgi:hypothetical protein